MIRPVTGIVLLLLTCLLCSPVFAEHIQYVDPADVGGLEIGAGDTWTVVFDLTSDLMYLWELTTPTSSTGGPTPDLSTADSMGSYDPAYALHYVTLRIDPNHFTGESTSTFIELTVNGIAVPSWENPISLYGWGVPGGSFISDPYGIVANNYLVTVTLTGLGTLGSNSIPISNVNLEGCFDIGTPVPEPASMLLFGPGLIGLAVLRRRRMA